MGLRSYLPSPGTSHLRAGIIFLGSMCLSTVPKREPFLTITDSKYVVTVVLGLLPLRQEWCVDPTTPTVLTLQEATRLPSFDGQSQPLREQRCREAQIATTFVRSSAKLVLEMSVTAFNYSWSTSFSILLKSSPSITVPNSQYYRRIGK